MKNDTYWIHDTTLCIGTAEPNRDVYRRLLNALRKNGYRIAENQSVSKLIRSNYHIGGRGDLLMQSRHYPTGAQICFYQDLVHSNPNGGYYDFDKEAKMTYLMRLRFRYDLRELQRLLDGLGFINTTKPTSKLAEESVEYQRQSLCAFQGKGFYDGPRATYNATDADGQQLSDGDFRYFYGYDGHLRRGIIRHHINNMWWVIVSRYEYRNIACFNLFAYDPAKHPKRRVENPKRAIEAKLKTAVAKQDFERAIGLRDALRRQEVQA